MIFTGNIGIGEIIQIISFLGVMVGIFFSMKTNMAEFRINMQNTSERLDKLDFNTSKRMDKLDNDVNELAKIAKELALQHQRLDNMESSLKDLKDELRSLFSGVRIEPPKISKIRQRG